VDEFVAELEGFPSLLDAGRGRRLRLYIADYGQAPIDSTYFDWTQLNSGLKLLKMNIEVVVGLADGEEVSGSSLAEKWLLDRWDEIVNAQVTQISAIRRLTTWRNRPRGARERAPERST